MVKSYPLKTNRFVSDKFLAERYDVTRATIWRWVRERVLPPPIKMGLKTTRWSLATIELFEENPHAVEISNEDGEVLFYVLTKDKDNLEHIRAAPGDFQSIH